MAVWTSVKGSVKVLGGCHLSLAKFNLKFFETNSIMINKDVVGNYWVYNISFNYIGDGFGSAKQVEQWVSSLKDEWGATVDIEASIRWYE